MIIFYCSLLTRRSYIKAAARVRNWCHFKTTVWMYHYLMPKIYLAPLIILLLAVLIPPAVLASPTNDAHKLTLLESEFTRDGTVNLTKFDKLLKGRSQSQITRIFSKPDLIAVKGLDCPIVKANHEYWYYKSGGGNLVSIAFLNKKCVSAKVTNPAQIAGIESYSFYCGDFLLVFDFTKGICTNIRQMMEFN